MKLAADLKRNSFDFDLILMPPSVVCSYADNLLEVPADVVSLTEASNTFFPQPLAGSTCGGRLFGLPVEYNLEYGGVVVNTDKYQAKYPGKTPGWATWEAFLEEASELGEFADGKPCANGLDIDPDWPEPARHILLSQILQRGGDYWGPTRDLFNFDTPEARASLTEMVKWVNTDKILSTQLLPDKNTFVTLRLGRGATGYGCPDPLDRLSIKNPLSVMGYVGTWGLTASVAERHPASTTKLDFYPLPPMVGSKHKFVQNAGFAFAVPKTSANAKVAWQIAKAIALSPDVMRTWAATAGTLPALRANGTPAAAAADPLLAKVQPMLEHGQWMGYIPAASTEAVLGAMVSNYFAAVKGSKTIEQALLDMQTTANAAIVLNR